MKDFYSKEFVQFFMERTRNFYHQEHGRKRCAVSVDYEAYVILKALSLKNKVPMCDIVDELLVRSRLKSESIIRSSTRQNFKTERSGRRCATTSLTLGDYRGQQWRQASGRLSEYRD